MKNKRPDFTQPPACKMCAFRKTRWDVLDGCRHDVDYYYEPVSGKKVWQGTACWKMREEGGACGPEGKLFRPRKARFSFGKFFSVSRD